MDTQHITNDSPNTQVPSSTIVPEENIIVPPTHGMRFQKHIDAFIHHPIVALAALLSVAAIGTLIARSTLTPQTASVEAGTSTVTVSLQPQTATFTTGGIVQLWVKTYKPLGFVSTRIKFDKTKVRLAGEVNTSPSPLARVIQKTSLSESNATGIIDIVVGLEPSARATPPSNSFFVAILPLTPASGEQNVKTLMTIDSAYTQAIGVTALSYRIRSIGSTVILNSTAIPTTPVAP